MTELSLPFCKTCLKTGILCGVCREKLKSGEYTDLDVEISKALLSFYGKERGKLGGRVEYKRSMMKNGLLVLILSKGSLNDFFAHGGIRLIRFLEDRFKRRVRVIEETENHRKMVRHLLPVKVQGLNMVYYPGDFVVLHVRVDKSDLKRIEREKSTYEELIREITGVSYVEISPM